MDDGICGQFNPKFTFGTFVVGTCNRLAHGAALALSRTPCPFNALFLYGGTGVGKTHLLHAVGRMLVEQHSAMRVVMSTGEQFTTDMVSCIRTDRMPRFCQHYRSADVLLLDDVQFFGNKGRSQEELTHTLNDLQNHQKQIVLSSDAPPNAIPGLIERLRSRFEGALLVEIEPTDLETKREILARRAAADGFGLPDDVRDYIAQITGGNLRQLEGALLRVVAVASLEKTEVNLTVAERALRSIVQARQRRTVTVAQIQRAVAQELGITETMLKGRRGSKTVIWGQHLAMYLVRDLRGESLSAVGRACGGRHHTSVLYAVKRVEDTRRSDPLCDEMIRRLIDRLETDP